MRIKNVELISKSNKEVLMKDKNNKQKPEDEPKINTQNENNKPPKPDPSLYSRITESYKEENLKKKGNKE